MQEQQQHEERLPEHDIHQNLIDGFADASPSEMSRTSVAWRVEEMDLATKEGLTFIQMHALIRGQGYSNGAELMNVAGQYLAEQAQVQQRLVSSLEDIPAISISAQEDELFI